VITDSRRTRGPRLTRDPATAVQVRQVALFSAWPRDSHRDPGIESRRGVQTGPPRLGRICWTLARLSSFSADTQSRPKSVGRPTSVNSIPCRTRVPTTADPRQLPWPVRAEFPSSDTRQDSFYCPATVRWLSGKFQSLPMTPNTFPQVRGCLPSNANWYRWAWPPRRPRRPPQTGTSRDDGWGGPGCVNGNRKL